MHDDTALHSQILLGICCADALGAATEFSTPEQVAHRLTGEQLRHFQSGSPFGFAPGEATDDSQMVVAHLLRPDDPAAGFRQWLACDPPDVGGLTAAALRGSGLGAWLDSGCTAAGNGGLMRVAATFLCGWRGERLLHEAVRATAVTHVDPRCTWSSAVLVATMEGLHRGSSLDDAARQALEAARPLPVAEHCDGRVPPGCFDQVAAAVEDGLAGVPGPQSGYVLHTLQQAIRRARAGGWLEGIVPVVAGGDDSDTTAAVAAALLGAKGLQAPAHLADEVRLGADWPGWQRHWRVAEHLDDLLPGVESNHCR